METDRHLVDAVDVFGGEHRVRRDVGEHRDLLLQRLLERTLRSAQQDLGLDADLAQLHDRVLRRLGLQLARGADVRHQRHVNGDGVGRADFEAQLPDRFEERQRFDVADGAADLDDQHVLALRALEDARLDLVGDVGNHLHGAAQVFAAPLFLDDGLVDLAAGRVVQPRHPLRDEALVVAEVEIGLRAVVGDEHLAVLRRVHRSRIDVEVRIQLLDRQLEPPGLQQAADRRRRQALAQRRDDATGDEDELRLFHRGSSRRGHRELLRVCLTPRRMSSSTRAAILLCRDQGSQWLLK